MFWAVLLQPVGQAHTLKTGIVCPLEDGVIGQCRKNLIRDTLTAGSINSPIPPELDAKTVRKIQKYRDKLKMWNLQVRRTREGTSVVKSVESKSI